MDDQFWLDTSVFTQANRGGYAFDVNPGFWDWLESEIVAGTLRSTAIVYDEIVHPNPAERDDLAEWAIRMDAHGFFVIPSPEVISEFTPIADHVHGSCDRAEADGFLSGADPWIIAHAKCGNGIVVTQEKPVGADSKKVKIPNICTRFGVQHIDTVELLRRRKVTFVRGKK